MSLSPFDSFQSRFVTYLLNFPRIIATSVLNTVLKNVSANSATRCNLKKKSMNCGFFLMQATTKTRKCLFVLWTKMVVQPSCQALELVVPPDR